MVKCWPSNLPQCGCSEQLQQHTVQLQLTWAEKISAATSATQPLALLPPPSWCSWLTGTSPPRGRSNKTYLGRILVFWKEKTKRVHSANHMPVSSQGLNWIHYNRGQRINMCMTQKVIRTNFEWYWEHWPGILKWIGFFFFLLKGEGCNRRIFQQADVEMITRLCSRQVPGQWKLLDVVDTDYLSNAEATEMLQWLHVAESRHRIQQLNRGGRKP